MSPRPAVGEVSIASEGILFSISAQLCFRELPEQLVDSVAPAAIGVQDDEVVLPRDRVGCGLEVHRDVELLDRLLAVQLDEVPGQDLGVAGHVEDPLLRIERGELAAELR